MCLIKDYKYTLNVYFRFIEIELTEDKGVPTEFFLNCCSEIFALFDNFGSTTFLPVKIDVYGNINVCTFLAIKILSNFRSQRGELLDKFPS